MWGQVNNNTIALNHLRIIPTRVGTSQKACICVIMNRDHPHACGDKGTCVPSSSVTRGSSPRVWGQVILNFGKIHYHGIIPTRVGTSCRDFETYTDGKDHPHACGDKLIYGFGKVRMLGSSPRVWGQAFQNLGNLVRSGIIPTRVGTSDEYLAECTAD